MRLWLVQLDKATSRVAYTGEHIATHSSCTLFQWNCGTVCCCALKTGCFGLSDLGCIPLGGAIALGNTILWMSTPYVDSATGGADYFWVSFSCTRCHQRPFVSTCSQFAWGSSPMSCPDGYQFGGFPFTSAENTCCGCCWIEEFCNPACNNEMRTGLTTKLDVTSNTFVSFSCFNCTPSTGGSMYFNYPNAGNTAQQIYGCCECSCVVYPALGLPGPYCNIGATSHGNCSYSPFGSGGPGGAGNRDMSIQDFIPGCTQPAFCESFMYVQGTGSTINVRGWPCAIVYNGSCGWNWGSTPCVNCCTTCPFCTWAMCCGYTNAGRCGFSGASYGWIFTCPQGNFTCIGAFGGTCCVQGGQASSRFVCTANGMPSVLMGAIACGTGFYANGQTFSTCVFKLRFLDMF